MKKEELLFNIIQPEDKKTVGQRLTESRLKDLYCDQGKSLEDIAKMFNCSKVYVHMLMKQYEIQARNRSEASAQAKRMEKGVRFIAVNESFFKARTPQMAYVLGCIYANGIITEKLNVFSFLHADSQFVNKIKDIFGSSHKIKKAKPGGLYRLSIGNKNMIMDLLSFGITPGAELDKTFPMLDDKLYPHFIRGYFDSRGKMTILNDHWRISFASSSKAFIEALHAVLMGYARTNKRSIYAYSSPEAYQLTYEGKVDLDNIFYYLYDENSLSQKLFLNSQYELFLKRND